MRRDDAIAQDAQPGDFQFDLVTMLHIACLFVAAATTHRARAEDLARHHSFFFRGIGQQLGKRVMHGR